MGGELRAGMDEDRSNGVKAVLAHVPKKWKAGQTESREEVLSQGWG